MAHISKMQKYIDARIEQLIEEAAKCHDQYDRLWYNKLIAELHWVSMMGTDLKVDELPTRGEEIMKYLGKLMGERTSLDGVVLIGICGAFILFGGLAKIAAYVGLAWGVYTLLKTEK